MLKLTRKAGDAVQIGTDIVVQVVSVAGGRVVLGFSAPAATKILRTEIANDEQPAASVDDDMPEETTP